MKLLPVLSIVFLRATSAIIDEELAQVFHTTGWRDLPDYEQDWFEKYKFTLETKVGEFVQVAWEDVLANENMGFVPMDPTQSWFGHFLALMTDGKDYRMNVKFERIEEGSGLLGYPLGEFYESDIFRGAPGCGNGIDLEGNSIENVLLRTDHETQPAEANKTEHRLNFTVSFQGRPFGPYEDALAIALFSTGWESEDSWQTNLHNKVEDSTFLLSVDEYTRVNWEFALANSTIGIYRPLDTLHPSYDSFISLLTDGRDLELSPCLEMVTVGDGGISGTQVCMQPRLESDIFQNQSGCSNGVDLEGNLIKKISLRVDKESTFRSQRNETATMYNFTILFEGRLLEPYEDALAVVDFSQYGCFYQKNVTVDFVVIDGPSWALQEHFVDFDTVQVNEPLPLVDEYGTHSMHEMLTDGSNGYFHLDMGSISTGASESIFLHGEPGCLNGIDLEGSYVEEVLLVLRDETDFDGQWCRSVSPRLVILGTRGDDPETTTPCPYCPTDSATWSTFVCYPWTASMICMFLWTI